VSIKALSSKKLHSPTWAVTTFPKILQEKQLQIVSAPKNTFFGLQDWHFRTQPWWPDFHSQLPPPVIPQEIGHGVGNLPRHA
jgi:hypothetical protein